MKKRRLIAWLVGVAAVVGLMLTGAPAALAAGANTVTVHKCLRNLPVTFNAYKVTMYAEQTCGFSYRAWGYFSTAGFRYGTYRSTNGTDSVACGMPSTCSSGGGELFKGGYQVKRTGKYVCSFGCASNPTMSSKATPLRKCARSVTTTSNAYSVVAHLRQTCGRAYRAWLFSTDGRYHYGTYHIWPGGELDSSAACVNVSTCGSGAGTVIDGGYQRQTDGKEFCTVGCGTPTHTVAIVRFSSGTTDVSSGTCHNEWMEGTTNLDGTDPWTQWVQGGGTSVNGCGWQQRCHVHFGIPKQGDDDGWIDGGWVRSGSIVSGCQSPDGDPWIAFDVQWRSSNGIIHTFEAGSQGEDVSFSNGNNGGSQHGTGGTGNNQSNPSSLTITGVPLQPQHQCRPDGG